MTFEEDFSLSPIIPILRGLQLENVDLVCESLADVGIRTIEVPLNRPEALECIARISEKYSRSITVGAGTVVSKFLLNAAHKVGVKYIVSPNFNPEIVRESLALGLTPLPGIMTPSELFSAYDIGVRYFKLFPFEALGPSFLKSISTVAPADAQLIPVGGVTISDIPEILKIGGHGVGLGSSLFSSPFNKDTFLAKCAELRKVTSALSNKASTSTKEKS